jgi:hypothetical protein
MTSVLSSYNNTNKPINSLITFGGKYELVNAYTSYSLGIKTDSACVITIYQSYNGITDDDFDVFVTTSNIFANHQANLYLPYARISILNSTGTNQTYMLCTTKWTSVIPLPISNISLLPNSSVSVSGQIYDSDSYLLVDLPNVSSPNGWLWIAPANGQKFLVANNSQVNKTIDETIAYNWGSSIISLNAYSFTDIYMVCESISSVGGMKFLVQFSPDGIIWFESSFNFTITALNLNGSALTIKTALPRIRLIADPANLPLDTASNVSLWITTKAI